MSSQRSSHTATLLADGTVLITGGFNSWRANSSAEIYDLSTGSFSPTGNMTSARFDHTATLLPDGTVLVAGGFDPLVGALAIAEIYDPLARTFARVGAMTVGRYRQGEGLFAGSLLMLPAGSPAPPAAKYTFVGTFKLTPGADQNRQDRGDSQNESKDKRPLRVDVYLRR